MEPLWDLLEKVGIEVREESDEDDVLQGAKADASRRRSRTDAPQGPGQAHHREEARRQKAGGEEGQEVGPPSDIPHGPGRPRAGRGPEPAGLAALLLAAACSCGVAPPARGLLASLATRHPPRARRAALRKSRVPRSLLPATAILASGFVLHPEKIHARHLPAARRPLRAAARARGNAEHPPEQAPAAFRGEAGSVTARGGRMGHCLPPARARTGHQQAFYHRSRCYAMIFNRPRSRPPRGGFAPCSTPSRGGFSGRKRGFRDGLS